MLQISSLFPGFTQQGEGPARSRLTPVDGLPDAVKIKGPQITNLGIDEHIRIETLLAVYFPGHDIKRF